MSIIQHVANKASFSSGTTGTITTAVTAVAAGNCLVACIGAVSGPGTPSVSSITISSNAENWADGVEVDDTTSSNLAAIWTDQNTPGGGTSLAVKVAFGGTASSSNTCEVFVDFYEVSGIVASGAVDVTHKSGMGNNSTSWSSGTTGTTSQASEYAFGVMVASSGGTLSVTGPSSPWTNENTQSGTAVFGGFSGPCYEKSGYNLLSAVGTVKYNGTLSLTGYWDAAVLTLEVASVVVNPPVPEMPRAVRPYGMLFGRQGLRDRQQPDLVAPPVPPVIFHAEHRSTHLRQTFPRFRYGVSPTGWPVAVQPPELPESEHARFRPPYPRRGVVTPQTGLPMYLQYNLNPQAEHPRYKSPQIRRRPIVAPTGWPVPVQPAELPHYVRRYAKPGFLRRRPLTQLGGYPVYVQPPELPHAIRLFIKTPLIRRKGLSPPTSFPQPKSSPTPPFIPHPRRIRPYHYRYGRTMPGTGLPIPPPPPYIPPTPYAGQPGTEFLPPVWHPDQVLYGIGYMFVSPVGTPLPADYDLGDEAMWYAAGWRYVGASDQGVTFTYNPQLTSIFIEAQELPFLEVVDSATYQFTISLAEETFNTISLAYGELGVTSVTQPGIGQPGKQILMFSEQFPELAVAILGQNALGYPRILYVPVMQSVGQVQTSFRRSASERLYPVTLTALCDPSRIELIDITASETAFVGTYLLYPGISTYPGSGTIPE